MLFNGSNLTASANDLEWNDKKWSIVNHFIPFTEEEVGSPDRFESDFMVQYIKDKTFSAEAKAVLEEGKKLWQKKACAGDLIVVIGGRVGMDGIHGATFSSESLSSGSPATAVQIGDPITQKKMTDFLLEARDLGLYSSLTDNGAGGLSSSIGEMARDCGGAVVDLEKAPLKYQGLDPWEIFVS